MLFDINKVYSNPSFIIYSEKTNKKCQTAISNKFSILIVMGVPLLEKGKRLKHICPFNKRTGSNCYGEVDYQIQSFPRILQSASHTNWLSKERRKIQSAATHLEMIIMHPQVFLLDPIYDFMHAIQSS